MKITKLPELSHVKDLLALYPAILLRVHSKSHALSARAEYDIPEDGVEMRYEFDIDKLYITRTFFTSRDSLDILKSLQGYLTYVGSCSMRITRGTSLHSNNSQCYCFDLTRPHIPRDNLKPHQRKIYQTTKLNTDLRRDKRAVLSGARQFMQSLPDQQFKSEFAVIFRNVMRMVKESEKLHTETIEMLTRETVRRKYRKEILKEKAEPVERVAMPELDALIKELAPLFIKRIDAWRLKDGVMVHKKEETHPFPVADKWDARRLTGLYEETSNNDGSCYRKILWIPIEWVRVAIKAGRLPKNFMEDKRCVVKENKYLVRTTIRCVKIDLRR